LGSIITSGYGSSSRIRVVGKVIPRVIELIVDSGWLARQICSSSSIG
jgi:hypothetical protein